MELVDRNFCHCCQKSQMINIHTEPKNYEVRELQKCPQCNIAKYCSSHCQRLDLKWNLHGDRCHYIKKIGNEIYKLENIVRLLNKILDLEDRQNNFQNFCEAIRTEKNGYLSMFNLSYPHIIEKFVLLILGQKEAKFKEEFSELENHKQNLAVFVESCEFLGYYFKFEDFVQYPTKVMENFSSENPNDWELSIEEKFPDYWNYFCKLFHEKPEARKMILELKFERERQDRARKRKREQERMKREYREREIRDRERLQRSRSQRSRSLFGYKKNFSYY